jgi:hypothetical protein
MQLRIYTVSVRCKAGIREEGIAKTERTSFLGPASNININPHQKTHAYLLRNIDTPTQQQYQAIQHRKRTTLGAKKEELRKTPMQVILK